jgi:hypothetical protein
MSVANTEPNKTAPKMWYPDRQTGRALRNKYMLDRLKASKKRS